MTMLVEVVEGVVDLEETRVKRVERADRADVRKYGDVMTLHTCYDLTRMSSVYGLDSFDSVDVLRLQPT